ncbi:MFS transporter [Parvicella tangerina]|uniref:MFS transporter n=1 Tax=Parvicella tangerina TaxID=2829795 RepID=A0A916JLN0_9FLAO|nr:MFS transporter [Parvicella tangerina]CAG5079218.1 hypothetical protein CRYO30217_00889 [Parvicella tangerina]
MLGFKNIHRKIWNVILSEAALQLINGALMVLLLLYLRSKGFSDGENASFFASRFLGVLFISLPFGLYIKGKPLANYFKIASVSLPLFTLIAIYFIEIKSFWGIHISFLLWGVAFSLAEIPKIPFIMRNASTTKLSNSISLAYSTWSFGAVTSGLFIFLLSNSFPLIFDHKNCLIFMVLISFIGAFFAFRIKDEHVPEKVDRITFKNFFGSSNWSRIGYALTPTFIIAVGAGMSVPFIPLYFEGTFHLKYDDYSGFSFLAYGLVFALILFAPSIKNKYGMKYSIPVTQSLSVLCLVTLALMDFYNDWNWALFAALGAYILRQPLMNIAQPLTTEVIMKYVDKDDHEVTASLMALIWNGSFVFSSLVFGALRDKGVPFYGVFSITIILYLVAIVWYQQLIMKTEKIT